MQQFYFDTFKLNLKQSSLSYKNSHQNLIVNFNYITNNLVFKIYKQTSLLIRL